MRSTKKLLSDHMPFSVTGGGLTSIAWNMLCQMSENVTHKYYNNGFVCKDETPQQYKNRLSYIASHLGSLAKNLKPAFICLQECPETESSRKEFIAELKKDSLKTYNVEYFNDTDDEYYLMTLYEPQKFELQNQFNEELKSIQLQDGLQKRVLPLVFRNLSNKEIILVVNVHAMFKVTIKKDLEAIISFSQQQKINHILLLGDFNRDLVPKCDINLQNSHTNEDIADFLNNKKLSDYTLFVNSVNASSIYTSNYQDKKQIIATVDGVISTFPVEIKRLTEVCQHDSTQPFNKLVSHRLSYFPTELLLNKNNDEKNSLVSSKVSNSITQSKWDEASCWLELQCSQSTKDKFQGLFESVYTAIKYEADKLGIPIKKCFLDPYITLLYGYTKDETDKLISVILNEIKEAFVFEADFVSHGLTSPMIIVRLKNSPRLIKLFDTLKAQTELKGIKHFIFEGIYHACLPIAEFDVDAYAKVSEQFRSASHEIQVQFMMDAMRKIKLEKLSVNSQPLVTFFKDQKLKFTKIVSMLKDNVMVDSYDVEKTNFQLKMHLNPADNSIAMIKEMYDAFKREADKFNIPIKEPSLEPYFTAFIFLLTL